jgi:hypothetical protein
MCVNIEDFTEPLEEKIEELEKQMAIAYGHLRLAAEKGGFQNPHTKRAYETLSGALTPPLRGWGHNVATGGIHG